MLDIRLVRLFLAIPSEENFYRGIGRYLHRRAIDRIVPKIVAWKEGKNMGMRIKQDQSKNNHLLRFSLSDLHPVMARYIDIKRFGQQIEQLPSILDKGMIDNKRIQIARNIRAVKNVCAWMNF
jgi:asparagine synthase (glutamine-hydrolysing)